VYQSWICLIARIRNFQEVGQLVRWKPSEITLLYASRYVTSLSNAAYSLGSREKIQHLGKLISNLRRRGCRPTNTVSLDEKTSRLAFTAIASSSYKIKQNMTTTSQILVTYLSHKRLRHFILIKLEREPSLSASERSYSIIGQGKELTKANGSRVLI